MKPMRHSLGLAAFAILALGACAEAPTEAVGLDWTVAPGKQLRGTIAADDTLLVRVRGPVTTRHRLYLWLESASVADSIDIWPNYGPPSPLINRIGTIVGNEPARSRWIYLPELGDGSTTLFRITVRGASSQVRVVVRSELPDRDPELVPAALPQNETIRETFDGRDDIDEYTIVGVANRRQLLYVSRSNVAIAHPLGITVWNAAGEVFAQMVLEHTEVPLGAYSLALNVPAGQTFKVTVNSTVFDSPPMEPAAEEDYGEYQLLWSSISTDPESAPKVLAIGDTITESLNGSGDEDQFVLPYTTGDRYAIALRLLTDVPDTVLMTLLPWSDTHPVYFHATEASDDLQKYVSPVTVAVGTDTRIIRIVGPPRSSQLFTTIQYQLEIRPIDPAPETLPASFTFGETVTGEAIDNLRDYDVFSVVIPPSVSFGFESQGDITASIQYPSWASNTSEDLHDEVSGDHRASRRFSSVQGGTFTVTIRERTGAPAPYSFRLHAVDPNPEAGGRALTLGDWRRGALELAGDVDTYTYVSTSGGSYAAYLRAVTGHSGVAAARVGDDLNHFPQGGWSGPRAVAAGDSLSVIVSGNTFSSEAGRTQYEVLLLEIDSLPESRPSSVALGDTISGESIEHRGDIDRFTVSVTAGTTISITWTQMPSCSGSLPNHSLRVLQNGTVIHQSYSEASNPASPATFVAPSSGTVELLVALPLNGWGSCGVGPYALVLNAVP